MKKFALIFTVSSITFSLCAEPFDWKKATQEKKQQYEANISILVDRLGQECGIKHNNRACGLIKKVNELTRKVDYIFVLRNSAETREELSSFLIKNFPVKDIEASPSPDQQASYMYLYDCLTQAYNESQQLIDQLEEIAKN